MTISSIFPQKAHAVELFTRIHRPDKRGTVLIRRAAALFPR
jgi:hypothetical protein